MSGVSGSLLLTIPLAWRWYVAPTGNPWRLLALACSTRPDVAAQQATGLAELHEIGVVGRRGDRNQSVAGLGDLLEVRSSLGRVFLAAAQVRRAGDGVGVHDADPDVLQRQKLAGCRAHIVDRVGAMVHAEGAADGEQHRQHDQTAARSSDSLAGVDVVATLHPSCRVTGGGGCGCVVVVAVGSTRTSSSWECMRNS